MRKFVVFLSTATLLLSISNPALAIAPSNDDFANATVVPSLPFNDSVSVVDATVQAGEPNPVCEPLDNTIWYRFKATKGGQVVFNVTGSDMAVGGGAFTGTSLSNLKNVACLESIPLGTPAESKLVLNASAGTTYYIQLGKGVESSNVGTIELNVQQGGSFAGTVFDAKRRPLNEACIEATDAAGLAAGNAFAPRSGRYAISGLDPGDYTVKFMDCSSGTRVYAPIWYHQQPNQASANPVNVRGGATITGINATLPVGGSIAGTVTDSRSAAPIADSCIEIWDANENLLIFTSTGADGTYLAGPLQTGNYKVDFYSCDGNYLPEWYHDRSSFASADSVSVIVGSKTTGINDDLVSTSGTSSIDGTITDPDGNGVGGICVDVDVANEEPAGGIVVVAGTIADYYPAGHYVISGLAAGTYHVRFTGCGQPYADQWFNGKADFESSDPVVLTEGNTTTVDVVVQPTA